MRLIDCALFMILVTVIGCSRNQNIGDKANTILPSEGECFMYVQNQDTIRLQIVKSQDKASGQLTYNLFEKDSNDGTINGIMKGDTLFADYKFMSEGVESVREVVFVKIGNSFIEAYGDTEYRNNKVVFTDPSALILNKSIILEPYPCE